MHRLLWEIKSGEDWSERAQSLFEGQGPFGNGAAMRVAPVGAFFAGDMNAVVEQTARSSVITHTHDEAIAGGIAVAVATARAHELRSSGEMPSRSEFLDLVLPYVPESEVRSKIRQARDMSVNASVQFAVSVLGMESLLKTRFLSLCGARVSICRIMKGLWLTVSGLGDRDTTCAIVGGIVATYTGVEGIPHEWLTSRGSLPAWPFE